MTVMELYLLITLKCVDKQATFLVIFIEYVEQMVENIHKVFEQHTHTQITIFFLFFRFQFWFHMDG